MSSREAILHAVAAAQPEEKALPQISIPAPAGNVLQQFEAVLRGIGGVVAEAPSREAAISLLQAQFTESKRIVFANEVAADTDPHLLADVDLAIVEAQFGVAENGAVWITDAQLSHRVLPFIAQHLAVILPKHQIVPTMHQAYEKIGAADYGFGVFIAGPSKTADIEQSLVLGAHGARTMHLILV